MNLRTISLWRVMTCILLLLVMAVPLYAKDEKVNLKEPGIYIKTDKGLKRLMPNIVFEEKGVLYIESSNPPRFVLKDVEYFVISGKHDLNVLTINPMGFFQTSPFGKPRFMFGKEVTFDIKLTGTDLYTVKPKGLLGRGYYSLWINDSAWDFLLD